jgi:hypothetical protein
VMEDVLPFIILPVGSIPLFCASKYGSIPNTA